MKKITLGLSLVALSIAGVAYADHHDSDADGNRSVARAQAQAHAAAMFARMDVNKDGKLDAADRATQEAEKFARIDTNKDGTLSRDEFGAGRNHGAGANGAERPDRMAHRGGNGAKRGSMMLLRMADTNQDQSVTSAEFTAAHLKRFETSDANKDGTLTREERQAAKAKMREHMRSQKGDRMGRHDMAPPAS